MNVNFWNTICCKKADELYNEHFGGPRLNRHSLCWDCVTTRCITTKLKSQLEADNKVVTTMIKTEMEP